MIFIVIQLFAIVFALLSIGFHLGNITEELKKKNEGDKK